MQVIRAENYRRTRWKNGGGETSEIAIFPPTADLDTFGWRISMASIAADGPFSLFAGVDRSLAVLQGDGLRLDMAGRAPVELATTSPPLALPADIAAFAHLANGPVEDLNVMTRRAHFSHKLTPVAVDASLSLLIAAPVAIVFCHTGTLEMGTARERATLGPRDSLLIEGWDGEPLFAKGRAAVFLVEIWRSHRA